MQQEREARYRRTEIKRREREQEEDQQEMESPLLQKHDALRRAWLNLRARDDCINPATNSVAEGRLVSCKHLALAWQRRKGKVDCAFCHRVFATCVSFNVRTAERVSANPVREGVRFQGDFSACQALLCNDSPMSMTKRAWVLLVPARAEHFRFVSRVQADRSGHSKPGPLRISFLFLNSSSVLLGATTFHSSSSIIQMQLVAAREQDIARHPRRRSSGLELCTQNLSSIYNKISSVARLSNANPELIIMTRRKNIHST